MQLSKITTQNLNEYYARGVLQEAARCAELSDRILYGDGWAIAGCPADAQARPMSKAQSDLFQSLEQDQKVLLEQFGALLQQQNPDRPYALALEQTPEGWRRLTDVAEAFHYHKAQARNRWLAQNATTIEAPESRAADSILSIAVA